MIDEAMTAADHWTAEAMEARIVRYDALRPCYNAFIDTRTPGSEAKENFTIIGPGVSENPQQFVHIPEAHGFNIGGARQPPHCVNSQHSHETAEVFVVHTGRWRFDLGETGEDAQVEAGPGDVISLPTRMFRGFTNIGDDAGFLWAVLGSDAPGRVTWAPQVFDMARDYGLVLLESGRLIDTTAGETVPANARQMPPTTAEQAQALQRFRQAEAERLIVSRPSDEGSGETLVIGRGAPLDWNHGFTLSRLALAAGETVSRYRRERPEVVFVDRGSLELVWDGGRTTIGAGDTVTLPSGLARAFVAVSSLSAFIVRGGDELEPALAA